MRTSSIIFAALFTMLGLLALAGALTGAKHQWFMVAICSIMAVALAGDAMKKPEKTSLYR